MKTPFFVAAYAVSWLFLLGTQSGWASLALVGLWLTYHATATTTTTEGESE